ARAPYATTLTPETRPRRRDGVTDWRSVVVLITQRIGPAPSRKKPSPASNGVGKTVVSAITAEAPRPVTGPSPTTVPNGNTRMMRVAASAPPNMPPPYIASVVPTPLAD